MLEALAGLAGVSLEQGDSVSAVSHVQRILDHLAKHPRLEGTHEPVWVCHVSYRVLSALQDPRVEELLHYTYHLLMDRAAKIEDEALRSSFLENVPANREIVAAWEALQGRTGPLDTTISNDSSLPSGT